MKTNKQWAAALCMIAMAGCASDRINDTPTGASNTPMTNSTAQAGMSNGGGARMSSGVVQAIDQMQRQDVGVGVMGAAAAGGGTGAGTDKVYRVTVRMEDGSSQMVVVDSMPGYKIGDRVRYGDGTVAAY
jgi:hypothetical protein